MNLFNKIDKKVLKRKLEEDDSPRLTLSFYKYFAINDPEAFRDRLYQDWQKFGVMGRVYVSYEGINAQISVLESCFEGLKSYLDQFTELKNNRLNIAIEDDGKSFYKLKVKVREKIVADGLRDGEIDLNDGGEHVSAEKFNHLVEQEETILIDMRNHYESEVGHFKGAVCPDVDTFRESLPKLVDDYKENKDKPIVMYCTGGIRCEKASAYFKSKGFNEVYQLDGGIIEYTRQVKNHGLENKFLGKNFVFDERLAERISEEVISECHQCGDACDDHVNCANEACNLLFIQCENCKNSYNGCCCKECMEFKQLPEEVQKEARKGFKNEQRYFKKGRFQEGSAFASYIRKKGVLASAKNDS